MKNGWAFVCMVLISSCATCPKAKVNSKDATPPTLTWNVMNMETNAGGDHPATTALNAKRGESYRVIAKAHDPDGLQSIAMNQGFSGEAQWTCTTHSGGENLGQTKTATFAPAEQKLTPDANGEVLQDIFLIQNVDLTMPCQDASWQFSSGNVTLTAQAKNWGNQVTSGTLTIHVTP
jgi:hypothetical protein